MELKLPLNSHFFTFLDELKGIHMYKLENFSSKTNYCGSTTQEVATIIFYHLLTKDFSNCNDKNVFSVRKQQDITYFQLITIKGKFLGLSFAVCSRHYILRWEKKII